MKTFLLQLLAGFATLAFLSDSAFALVEAGHLQIGRYEMDYSGETPVVDVLEILPNSKFRFTDNGTQKEVFIFEGRIENLQAQPDGTYTMELITERDGRILRKKVSPRAQSEFNLRLKKMTLKVFERRFSTSVIFIREHSYRGQAFWPQSRMSDLKTTGQIQNFNFVGLPVDYGI